MEGSKTKKKLLPGKTNKFRRNRVAYKTLITRITEKQTISN